MLERAGAEIIVLCTNTMHVVAPAIEAAIVGRFLHLADTTAEAVVGAGRRRVGAARHPLHDGAGLLPGRLERTGSRCSCPTSPIRRWSTT